MTANQKRCLALLQAGRLCEAIESYQYIMDVDDITTKANALDWSTGKSSVNKTHYNPHLYLIQFSSENAARFVLPMEILPSLRAIMTELSTYTQQQSSWILHPIPSLQSAVRPSREKSCGWKHLTMRKKYDAAFIIS
jgi:hypothetical protein